MSVDSAENTAASPQPNGTTLVPTSLIFRKNAQHLYNSLLCFELPWPSTCIQFVPELITNADSSTKQKLICSTVTGNQASEYLRILELTTPQLASFQSLDELDNEQGVIGGFNPGQTADLTIVQKIFVDSTIQSLKLMPQNPNIIATCQESGRAGVWDTTKFPYKPVDVYLPTISLETHQDEGLVSGWSPTMEGELAIGDKQGLVKFYNIRKFYDASQGQMASIATASHKDSVNDLQYHPRRPGIVATCGDDKVLKIIANKENIVDLVAEHTFDQTPTCLAWNPVNDSLMAVGFENGAIELMDLRDIPTSIMKVQAHEGYITKIRWNTWHPSVFASASEDTKVKIWNGSDLSLLFTHAGHQSPVTELDWNPAIPACLASVAEDNGLHIYEPLDQLIGF